MMEVMEQAARPRRVLHFLESGGLYGAESVILNLSREMQKSSDYIPVIACIVQKSTDQVALYQKAASYGIESHKIVINNKKFLFDIFIFFTKLKKLQIEIVHSHGYKSSIICFFVNLFLGIPMLPTCHLWFWGTNTSIKYRMMTFIEIFLYKFVKKITVVSLPIKETLEKKGVLSKKIQIIKNGIYMDDFAELTGNEILYYNEILNINKKKSLIINIGRIVEQKAQINIIKAAKILKLRKKEFLAIIVGDGPLKEKLQQLIFECSVENEVKIIGFRDDAIKILRLADVFILPSIDEGMPMALLEAIASKVPVIATGVGDIPRILENGKCGIEVTVNDVQAIADSIDEILWGELDKSSIVENAYQKVKNEYSSKKMFTEYDKLYKEIIGNNKLSTQ